VLFKSRVANDKFDLPSDYGWTPLVQSIEMVEVPGEHLRIFERQHVGQLAEEVRKRIG
jgi:thioesterase domain-containing protein